MALLWERARQDRARHHLSDVLYLARRGVGSETITSAGRALHLNPKAVADLGEFLDALQRRDREQGWTCTVVPFWTASTSPAPPPARSGWTGSGGRMAVLHVQALAALAQTAQEMGDYRGGAPVAEAPNRRPIDHPGGGGIGPLALVGR
jgi:hypothetical protein